MEDHDGLKKREKETKLGISLCIRIQSIMEKGKNPETGSGIDTGVASLEQKFPRAACCGVWNMPMVVFIGHLQLQSRVVREL